MTRYHGNLQHNCNKYKELCYYFGAGKRNRTPDLLITNELLYRLSYSGVGLNYSGVAFWLRRGIRSRGRLRFYYPK